MYSVFFKLLPKNLLSYWFGKWAQISWPKPLQKILLKSFAVYYHIDLQEAEHPIEEYRTLNEFFVRRLKEGVRPLGKGVFVHPADSCLTARGQIVGDIAIQAKGHQYLLSEFLQESAGSMRWHDGIFLTYYLCPTDYHRVHSPVDGKITRIRYVPGQLWPVNQWSVENVHKLFARNERVILELETASGPMAFVFVGATNVGSIRLTHETQFRTNHHHVREPHEINYLKPIEIKRGEELGYFAMGSTVIVIANRNWHKILNPLLGKNPPEFQNSAQVVKVKADIQELR